MSTATTLHPVYRPGCEPPKHQQGLPLKRSPGTAPLPENRFTLNVMQMQLAEQLYRPGLFPLAASSAKKQIVQKTTQEILAAYPQQISLPALPNLGVANQKSTQPVLASRPLPAQVWTAKLACYLGEVIVGKRSCTQLSGWMSFELYHAFSRRIAVELARRDCRGASPSGQIKLQRLLTRPTENGGATASAVLSHGTERLALGLSIVPFRGRWRLVQLRF